VAALMGPAERKRPLFQARPTAAQQVQVFLSQLEATLNCQIGDKNTCRRRRRLCT
jgi:hypothetical protein